MTTSKWARRLLVALFASVSASMLFLGSAPIAVADSSAYDPRDEARTLTKLLYNQRLVHDRQKAYWRVGWTDIQINVYGVADGSTQQHIIEVLHKSRDARSRNSLRVAFYPDERFETRRLPNGVVEGKRVPQQPLRTHVIDAKN